MPTQTWMPIAAAAIDVRGHAAFDPRVEVVLLPVDGRDPLALLGAGARVWRDLVGAHPAARDALRSDDVPLIRELVSARLVAEGAEHPDAVRSLPRARFPSPLHELVHVVVARVAVRSGIRCVFVKGPTLFDQRLREREHSGDVDVWCDPDRWVDLIDALERHGWTREPDPWWGTPVGHSATLTPGTWGCQIDVHRRMPGTTLDDAGAFSRVYAESVPTSIAGVSVLVPSREAHAVIAALHAARPEVGRTPREHGFALAAEFLRRVDDPVGACDRLGAVPALRAALRQIVTDAEIPASEGLPRD
ncbi:nucleotidyltransferase family protein [Microbacterium sp. NPDC090007]|uniref:nucleotidyltransferase family protein n=1 Tax=Microbacterium sp. NPDC090007 TaxID=3364204 RepID=UPI0038180E92